MYRLYIVDDERRTRNGLATMVDWESLGFQVSGLFSDGKQALEAFARQPADVVLTDIRMEGMSGIDLAEQLCRHYPQVCILFISGHRDFEYARLAISYRVQGYLLKPIKLEELKAAFNHLREHLDASGQEIPVTAPSITYLQKEFFRFLLNGIADVKIAATEAQRLGLEAVLTPYRLATLELENDVACSFEEEMLDDFIYRLCSQEALLVNPTHLLRLRGNRYALLLPPLEMQEVTRRFRLVLSNAAQNADIPLLVGISKTHTGCREAALAYREACAVLKSVPTVYTDSPIGQPSVSVEDLHEIIQYLSEGNETAVHSMTILAANRLESQGQCLAYVKNQLVQFLSQIIAALPENCQTHEVNYIALCQAESLEETVRAFILNLAPVLHLSLQQKSKNRGQELSFVLDYLNAHFTDPTLSLEQLATIIFVSPSYFSRLFKQETGEKFSEYLTRMRLQHAKKLLEQGVPIGEASRRSGYLNTKYFSRLFKSQIGLTASEYKAGG